VVGFEDCYRVKFLWFRNLGIFWRDLTFVIPILKKCLNRLTRFHKVLNCINNGSQVFANFAEVSKKIAKVKELILQTVFPYVINCRGIFFSWNIKNFCKNQKKQFTKAICHFFLCNFGVV